VNYKLSLSLSLSLSISISIFISVVRSLLSAGVRPSVRLSRSCSCTVLYPNG